MASGDNVAIDFQKLKLERVIDESSHNKSITYQASYDGQPAVILLEKTPFDDKETTRALSGEKLISKINLNNDIYSRYSIEAPSLPGFNDLKAILIAPANEAVISKYSKSETVLFSETIDVYRTIVEPFIADMLENSKDYNQWVYNILEGKSEVDHVIFNDPDHESGFILLPSLKSSGDERDLHILAICHRRDIRSLRDLNANHLPLLNNILDKGSKIIKEKYCSVKSQLRAFIHYHPTFYHFHVHFKMVDAADYRASDRDNLLVTVINNINLIPNYYSSSTLTYPLSKSSSLYQILESRKVL